MSLLLVASGFRVRTIGESRGRAVRKIDPAEPTRWRLARGVARPANPTLRYPHTTTSRCRQVTRAHPPQRVSPASRGAVPFSSAARPRAGKSAAFLQAKTLSCSSRDAGCTRGRLLVLKLVGGWCLPPRRFNIADCPPSLCVAEALAEWLLAGRGAACWGVARAGARGGRQGGRRGGRMLRKTRQTRPLQSMRRSLIHSKWLENGTFIRSQLTLDPVSH